MNAVLRLRFSLEDKFFYMKLINELSVRNNSEEFSNLWNSEESFLIHPNVLPVDKGWLVETLKLLPKEIEAGSFAMLTSGSTGQPKVIVGKKQRSIELVKAIHLAQELEEVESTLCALPLSYSYGFVNQWIWANHFKKQIVFSNGLSEPLELIEKMSSTKNYMMCLVGSLFYRFLKPEHD